MKRTREIVLSTVMIIVGVNMNAPFAHALASTPPGSYPQGPGSEGLGSADLQEGNLTFDFSHVYDRNLKAEILAALTLGFQVAASGGKHVQAEIKNLRGNGRPRTIKFYSDASEANPGARAIAETGFSTWSNPSGGDAFNVPPSQRVDLRVYLNPTQPDYSYLVNSVWHELLHITLSITHSQTTAEGSVPEASVNNAVWYSTIKGIMLDFPRSTIDPLTRQTIELYNPENSPWS